MRATTHNGRFNRDGAFSAKHNDRNFDLKNASHIDEGRRSQNVEWNYYGSCSFDDCEKKFYDEHFTGHLETQNGKYRSNGDYKKVRTMDEYRKAKQSCPEECIYQIGRKDETVEPSILEEIVREQIKWETEKYQNAVIMNWALHVDEEGAPHVHVRKVWVCHDKEHPRVCQQKALEEMGVPRPDPEKPLSRYNNEKMTYTRECREHFIELCHERGLEIETEPKERSQTGLSLIEYKARREEEKLQNLIKESEHWDKKVESLQEKTYALENDYTMKQEILDGMSKQIALGEREKERYVSEMNTMEKRIEEKLRQLNQINQKINRVKEEEERTKCSKPTSIIVTRWKTLRIGQKITKKRKNQSRRGFLRENTITVHSAVMNCRES